MRSSEKNGIHQKNKDIFGFHLHDFIEKQTEATAYEMALEFGITLGEVRKLKRQLDNR